MTELFFPPYSEINDALNKAKTNFQPAFVHGLMVAFLCSKKKVNWKKIIFETKKIKSCEDLLKNIWSTTEKQLAEFSFDFALLLPNDEQDINERAEALGLWCQGFLTGLKQIGYKNKTNPEIDEALKDLTEIALVDNGDIIENDEDETAYFELVEYVRLAALMIYQEIKPKSSSQTQSNQLH